MDNNIKAIDIMNYLFTPEGKKGYMESGEYKYVSRRFAGGQRQDQPQVVFKNADEFVSHMDQIKFDKVFISAFKMYSHRDRRVMWDNTTDQVYEQVSKHPDRLIGAAGYNPLRIEESLKDIDRAVKELGFKYVYFNSLCFDVPLNDKKLYPCYAKCNELGVPVGMQVGHSAENLPSAGGRPIFLDDVALDFPNLTIIASHTGWPWVDELVAMAMKFENVYCDISAWQPSILPKMHPSLMGFMDSRVGREKTLFGTNGRGLKEAREQFLALPLKDETKEKILRGNAEKIFKLA